MNEFKEGDLVRTLVTVARNVRRGSTGTVTGTFGSLVTVELHVGYPEKKILGFLPGELAHAEPVEMSEFRKGDRVVILITVRAGYVAKGMQGTVTSVSSAGFVAVQVHDGGGMEPILSFLPEELVHDRQGLPGDRRTGEGK